MGTAWVARRKQAASVDSQPTAQEQASGEPAPGMQSDAVEPVSDREEIARLAYSYWEARGFSGGSAEEDWFRAEAELKKSIANQRR